MRQELPHWVILTVALSPWLTRFTSVLASDDVIILAAGLELYSSQGFLLPIDMALLSTGPAHFLPVGGFITGLFAYLAVTMASVLEIAPSTSWGVLSWITMITCWRTAASLFGTLVTKSRRYYTTLLVGAGAGLVMQIPGDIHLNPILSFPIAGWLTTWLGLWIIKYINRRYESLRLAHVVILSVVGILIYELLIICVLFSVLFEAYARKEPIKRKAKLCATASTGLVIPLLHRIFNFATESTYAYSGAQLDQDGIGLNQLWSSLMSVLSAIPLGQTASVARFKTLDIPNISWEIIFLTVAVMVGTAFNGLTNQRAKDGRRIVLQITLAALSMAVLLGLTQKYSVHLSRGWGSTYLFFPLITVSVTLAIGLVLQAVSRSKGLFVSSIVVLCLVGHVHNEANQDMTEHMKSEWAWAKSMVDDVYRNSNDFASCQHYRSATSKALPAEFTSELIGRLDRYSQTVRNVGFCSQFDRLRLIKFSLRGDVGSPEQGGESTFWWVTGKTFQLRMTFLDSAPDSVTLPVGSSPCGASLSATILHGTTSRNIRLNDGPVLLKIEDTEKSSKGLVTATFDFSIKGSACLLEDDERPLVIPVSFPTEVS